MNYTIGEWRATPGLPYQRCATMIGKGYFRQMEELQKTMNVIKYKCWYYDTALASGTEEVPRNIPKEEIPEEILEYTRGYNHPTL